MERTRARASASQVRRPRGRSACWIKVDLKSSSCAGFYNPRREAGEVCYQCVSLMCNLPTPHAYKFSTLSLASSCRSLRIDWRLPLYVLLQACLPCPSGADCAGKRSRPMPRRGALAVACMQGTTPRSRIKVAGRLHIRCTFDTERWVQRCRFAGCQMPCR